MRLEVDQAGLYRVTYEALRDSGMDLAGYPSRALALTNRGHAVPIRVHSAGGERLDDLGRTRRLGPRGPRFGPGSFIEFQYHSV